MSRTRTSTAFLRVSLLAAAFATILIPPASAKTYQFTYTGSFSTANALNPVSAPAISFTSTTPFLITALFDDRSQNLAAPIGVPGFVSYSPLSATLTVSGQVYDFTTYAQNPIQGITIAVFDTATPFEPGHYAIGILQNPLADGAGIIGDFLSVSSPYTADSLHATVFTGYTGVGYGSGPPTDPTRTNHAVVPILLTGTGGNVYDLTLGNYDEEFADGGVQNTARLANAPVPEASSVVSLALLFALGLGTVVVRRKVRA